jgi:predicted nucleic acid-binding protein
MRVFLDASILFAAAKADGAVRQLVRLLSQSGHECCVDDSVVTEARRNLGIKGQDAARALDDLLAGMQIYRRQPVPGSRPELDWLPEGDRPVLAAAIHAQCEALVTADRTHFGAGHGKVFAGVTVHFPRSLAEWLAGS